MTTLQTTWNSLTIPWRFTALLRGTQHVKCYSYHARISTKYLYGRKYAVYIWVVLSNFSLTRFFPDTSLILIKFPEISLTAVEFPDISRFSRQVVTLQPSQLTTVTNTNSNHSLSFISCNACMHSARRSQQPPEWPHLSHVDCFSQCQSVGLGLSSSR